jgi:hypothetical protein
MGRCNRIKCSSRVKHQKVNNKITCVLGSMCWGLCKETTVWVSPYHQSIFAKNGHTRSTIYLFLRKNGHTRSKLLPLRPKGEIHGLGRRDGRCICTKRAGLRVLGLKDVRPEESRSLAGNCHQAEDTREPSSLGWALWVGPRFKRWWLEEVRVLVARRDLRSCWTSVRFAGGRKELGWREVSWAPRGERSGCPLRWSRSRRGKRPSVVRTEFGMTSVVR